MNKKKENKKTEIITIKISEKEKNKFQEEAEKIGLNLSQYVREQLKEVEINDRILIKQVKTVIRDIQTCQNMKKAGIDSEKQEEAIMERIEKLCALLK